MRFYLEYAYDHFMKIDDYSLRILEFLKIIQIHPLHFKNFMRRHPHIMLNHKLSQLLPVDQHDLGMVGKEVY